MALAQESRLQHSLKMEPGIERPQSALARGVQITEFKEACINPEPIVLEETDILMEQFLSPRKLRLLTGVDNLDDIKHLDMKVNTTGNSLGNFGQYLPNLRRLKVSNSTIPYIRDLGSSLRSLNVLWASRCALLELDGISSMCNLRELYLSYNEISDISPISMLDQIEILDLEGNNLDDVVQVQYLAICSKLSNLTLEGNPLCVAPSPDNEDIFEYDYRQAVKKAIPHLKTLDDELLIEGVGSFQKHNVFDADWAYLEELQKDMSLQEDTDSLLSDSSSRPPSGNRPSTAALKPNTGYRPGTALRPSSGFRPLTAGARPPTMGARPATSLGMRPGSGSNRPSSGGAAEGTNSETGDASDLTMGRVICGNPSKALLSRRRLNPDASGELDNQTPDIQFEPKFKHKAEHTYDVLPEEEKDRSEILSELKAWRLVHEVRMEKIREDKAPQVLRVDHDDAISLSGDSEVESDDEFSPLRDENDGTLHRMETMERLNEDQNLSSFVPAPTDEISSSPESFTLKTRSRDTVKEKNNRSVPSGDKDSESIDLLVRANTSENSFKISSLSNRHKAVIPPPSERDIVRKQTQAPVRNQSPLGLRTASPLQGIRTLTPSAGSSLRVNSTGLPKPPSSVPVISRSRRNDDLDHRSLAMDSSQSVIRSTSYDKPVPPPSQRPSTARAALGISSQPKIRRSLPSVPSLPSRPMGPPK